MKKFIGILLVIVILGLGAGGFFLGWVQWRIPPGSYGVVRSKFFGVEDQLVQEGQFRWLWYKLIPTNVEITVFTPSLVVRQIHASGMLPSGDVYGSFADLNLDFSYEISGVYSFMIKSSALLSLIKNQGINSQEALVGYEKTVADAIDAFIMQQFRNSSMGNLETIFASGTMESIDDAILAAFEDIENFSSTLRIIQNPDLELYQSVREHYSSYVARQYAILEEELQGSIKQDLDFKFRLEELANYGELLTKYPILLEYLALENERNGSD